MNGCELGVLAAFAALHVAYRLVFATRVADSREPLASDMNLVMAPGVSIIVPAWNDGVVLGRTARALDEAVGSYPGPVQVILVAGGTDDTYAEAARLAETRGWDVIEQSPRGKNGALNDGLSASRHGVFVFLDADTEVSHSWLYELVRPIAEGRAAATTGRFRAFRDTPVSTVFELEQEAVQRRPGKATLFGGGSIALDGKALEAIGGRLPEAVLVGVDFDLSERLRGRGLPIEFASGSRVRTEIAQTWAEYLHGEVRWRRAYLNAQLRHFWRDRSAQRLIGLAYVPLVQTILLAGLVIFPVASDALSGTPVPGLAVWAIFAFWVLGRHAAVCVEACARSRETQWIAVLPTYLFAFIVSAVATCIGLATLRNTNRHFKGRRSITVEG